MIFGFISVARSDFGRLKPVMELIRDSEVHSLRLIVAGNHLAETYGSSVNEIESSGFAIDCNIKSSGRPAESSAAILSELYTYLDDTNIDYLIVLGDRFEMLAAAQAATLARVPIIHIGGGYTTEGAIDNSIRDAITALSNQHLVATKKCFDKVLGIVPDRSKVHLCGAPDLEILTQVPYITKDEFCEEVGLTPKEKFILVTLHPETKMSSEEHGNSVAVFREFLSQLNTQILVTAPCADPGSNEIFEMIDELIEADKIIYKKSLGARLYINALRYTSLVLGNSSSGIIEAGSFRVPVINVGDRQKGREQNVNVINSTYNVDDLIKSYTKAISDNFIAEFMGVNIYGDGQFTAKFSEIFLDD